MILCSIYKALFRMWNIFLIVEIFFACFFEVLVPKSYLKFVNFSMLISIFTETLVLDNNFEECWLIGPLIDLEEKVWSPKFWMFAIFCTLRHPFDKWGHVSLDVCPENMDYYWNAIHKSMFGSCCSTGW